MKPPMASRVAAGGGGPPSDGRRFYRASEQRRWRRRGRSPGGAPLRWAAFEDRGPEAPLGGRRSGPAPALEQTGAIGLSGAERDIFEERFEAGHAVRRRLGHDGAARAALSPAGDARE